jgi:glutamate-1-semialdehyde aminotransferase
MKKIKFKDGTGQNLWNKAKKIIPGGNQLLSKRSEMFLPNLWPSYYSKAKGYEVWDLDGNKFKDFATMGIGACALGYADSFVNNRVKEVISLGSMCTLNAPEEVELAEKLTSLHPWSKLARFSRSGGEACSIALRAARASTKRNKVLFCGYHGWHDWYLSANLQNKENLNQQLLSGLSSDGVPNHLAGSALPFNYNDIEAFKDLIEQNRGDIAAVFMEPVRSNDPEPGFLESIRQITKKEGIILIFDEITSGFRINNGGVHMTFNVMPDIAVFGKALGNGFPISAIIGSEKAMSAIQDTFVSSTFWTERVGFAAGLATIEKFEDCNVVDSLVSSGKRINNIWKDAADASNIDIHICGLEPLTHIDFIHEKGNYLQTIYTQEMLKRGYLVGSSIYSTYAYDEKVLDKFAIDTAEVFTIIRKSIDSNAPEDFIDSEVKHSGFQRLS